jgi:hypothetical protein
MAGRGPGPGRYAKHNAKVRKMYSSESSIDHEHEARMRATQSHKDQLLRLEREIEIESKRAELRALREKNNVNT